MRALIAHRRLVTDSNGTQQYELAIGARTFACFNGFNVEGAFHKQNDPEMVSMVTDLEGHFNNRIQDWKTNNAQRAEFVRGKTTGEWECVAIGWLYNGAIASGNGPMHGRQVPSTAHSYDFVIGNALRREGFMGRYYDEWNGVYINSLRQLTPMETYLTRVFSGFEEENRHSVPLEVQNASAIAAAISHNAQFAGCLYQFVGSERPSGQAVAFLQTFRNVSEVQYIGWIGANSMKYNLIVAAYNRINHQSGESIYPLMDHLVNYGTDNAITCYAGAGVILHGMRYGYWSLKEFFHNTSPMTVEGRYNKGAQSMNLSAKYQREANRLNVSVNRAATNVLDLLKNAVTQTPQDIGQLVTHEHIMRNAGNIDGLIRTVTEHIRSVDRNNQIPNIARLIDLARVHGDARTPVAPPAPPPPPAPPAPVAPQGAAQSATPRNTTAGAAIGFTQWTSTAVH